MSVVNIDRTNGEDLTDAEARAAAQESWREAEAAGEWLTGLDLGRMFGKTDRWGRKQIERARESADTRTELPSTTGTPTTAETLAPLPRNATPPAGTAFGNGMAGMTVASRPQQPLATGVAGDVPVGSRPDDPEGTWSRRIIRWVTTLAVIVVAACAARSSYEHQRTVVEMAGNHDAAWYLPLSVDGMMLIASLNMLVRRWDGEPAGWLTWTALLLGGAASLAANIAAADPTWIGRLVAAWSPVCLIMSYELLMQQLPNRAPAATTNRRQP